jgi:hypothetical protein
MKKKCQKFEEIIETEVEVVIEKELCRFYKVCSFSFKVSNVSHAWDFACSIYR